MVLKNNLLAITYLHLCLHLCIYLYTHVYTHKIIYKYVLYVIDNI